MPPKKSDTAPAPDLQTPLPVQLPPDNLKPILDANKNAPTLAEHFEPKRRGRKPGQKNVAKADTAPVDNNQLFEVLRWLMKDEENVRLIYKLINR